MTKKTSPVKAPLTMVVQGTTVNASIISAYARRVGSLDDVLSVWANAATLQAAQGNPNWLKSLFSMPVLRLKSGDLSKAGKEVMSYIAAHYPAVKWDKQNGKVAMTTPKGENILVSHFVHPAAKEASDTVTQVRNKFYIPQGDFALTFTEFKNLEKEEVEKEDLTPSMQAKAFTKQAEKALDFLKESRFVGSVDELQAAANRAKELFMQLDAQLMKAAAAQMPVDMVKADELHKSGQAGKAIRAGGKVAPQSAAA